MFHVPELSRVRHGQLASDARSGNNGAFDIDSPEPGWRLALICSDGAEVPEMSAWQWEHVSVHAYRFRGAGVPIYHPRTGRPAGTERPAQTRTPTWDEMVYVKNLCWDAEDLAVQYHPRRSEYVNAHPHVLHLWRPRLVEIPTPPPELVGPKDDADGKAAQA